MWMDSSSTKSREKPFPGRLHLGLAPTVPGLPLGAHANAPPGPTKEKESEGLQLSNAHHATGQTQRTLLLQPEQQPGPRAPRDRKSLSALPGRGLACTQTGSCGVWAILSFLGAPLPRVFERLRIPASPVTKVIFCFLILRRVGSIKTFII